MCDMNAEQLARENVTRYTSILTAAGFTDELAAEGRHTELWIVYEDGEERVTDTPGGQ